MDKALALNDASYRLPSPSGKGEPSHWAGETFAFGGAAQNTTYMEEY